MTVRRLRTEYIEQPDNDLAKNATGTLQAPDPDERPTCVVALESVESFSPLEGCAVRLLGRTAGAVASRINHVRPTTDADQTALDLREAAVGGGSAATGLVHDV